jgi:transposase
VEAVLQVIAKQADHALHVKDRSHITQHLNKAVDEVRRGERTRLQAAGKAEAEQLKHMRWKLCCERTRNSSWIDFGPRARFLPALSRDWTIKSEW